MSRIIIERHVVRGINDVALGVAPRRSGATDKNLLIRVGHANAAVMNIDRVIGANYVSDNAIRIRLVMRQ